MFAPRSARSPRRLAPFAPSLLAALVASCGSGASTVAPPVEPPDPGRLGQLVLTLVVAGGSEHELSAVAQPAGDTRLFLAELDTGQVRIVDNGAVLPTPFLDVSGDMLEGEEQGLLGLAFHPNFLSNRKFYVSYTLDTGEPGTSVVREYKASLADPNVADPASERTIFSLPQTGGDHNAGCIRFGPDGMLYLSLGDGGEPSHDPSNQAQDLSKGFGKILRFDVDIPFPHAPADNPFYGQNGGEGDLVWHLGFRNPWQFSFDPLTGDMWIADVGFKEREEVNFAPAGMGGLNFGWNCTEGSLPFPGTGCTFGNPDLTGPLHEYQNGGLCNAIAGGMVYRGSAIPALNGHYLYADVCTGQLWSLTVDQFGIVDVFEHSSSIIPTGGWIPIAFGQGSDGEVYVVDLQGRVWRIDEERVEPDPPVEGV